jgi:Uma2 family endonuclease
MTTAPSSFHQWILQQLYDFVGFPAKSQGLAYPFFAPIGVIMPGADPVQPDFVLVLKERAEIIRDRRIMGVPDLIVEVLSPGSTTYDEQIKLEAYAKAGVPEYAIIDPGKRQVSVYRLDEPGKYADPLTLGEDESLTFNCLPSISAPVRNLFDGAPDTTL